MDDGKLSALLSEFARTMLTEFRIQAILDHLVGRIVEVLPITAAGVTLITPGLAPRYVAASDAAAPRFEQLQTEFGQGPCLSSFTSGAAVVSPDLAGDARFPMFGPAASSAGLAAVFTFPLRSGAGPLGALDLYRDVAGPLGEGDLTAAQTLADVAAAYLLNAQARELVTATAAGFRDSALHDSLTGLPNRLLLKERLEHAAERAVRSRGTCAVLFADLDRFKRINDTYGHAVGDGLLVAVAQRLRALLRPGDTLARISGDEFVFLCEDLGDPADVELLARRIDAAFVAPFNPQGADGASGNELLITASVGIAYSGPGEVITDRLVADADTAMYQAKRRGGATHQVIDLRAAQQARDDDDLERDLRAAVADQASPAQDGAPDGTGLYLCYQPIVRALDGLVVGVESLVRWTHPRYGPIPALTAIGLAEASGLIVDLGGWVLRRACSDHASWLAEHPGTALELSVNVSVRQLLSDDFPGEVAAALAATGTKSAELMLEVTEGIFINESERAIVVLAALRALGVRLALDDFGTGYSSLGYLQRFAVDVVKLDQSFVSTIDRHPFGAVVPAAITHLAHVLGLTVTAEGVETEQQRRQVLQIGCENAQGYLYAHAMTARDVSDALAASPGGRMYLPRSARTAG